MIQSRYEKFLLLGRLKEGGEILKEASPVITPATFQAVRLSLKHL